MKTAKIAIVLSALLALTACGPSRHTASDVNLKTIPEYAFIQPYSFIVCYGDDGKGYYDQGDSDTAVESLTGIQGLTNPSRDYSVSSPYGNIMFCAVIDGETDRVVHFVREVPTFASHPTESGNVSELLHKLLKEFIR